MSQLINKSPGKLPCISSNRSNKLYTYTLLKATQCTSEIIGSCRVPTSVPSISNLFIRSVLGGFRYAFSFVYVNTELLCVTPRATCCNKQHNNDMFFQYSTYGAGLRSPRVTRDVLCLNMAELVETKGKYVLLLVLLGYLRSTWCEMERSLEYSLDVDHDIVQSGSDLVFGGYTFDAAHPPQ